MRADAICPTRKHDTRSIAEKGYDQTQEAIVDRCSWKWEKIDGVDTQVPEHPLSVSNGQSIIFLYDPMEVWVFWPDKLPGGMIFR